MPPLRLGVVVTLAAIQPYLPPLEVVGLVVLVVLVVFVAREFALLWRETTP